MDSVRFGLEDQCGPVGSDRSRKTNSVQKGRFGPEWTSWFRKVGSVQNDWFGLLGPVRSTNEEKDKMGFPLGSPKWALYYDARGIIKRIMRIQFSAFKANHGITKSSIFS